MLVIDDGEPDGVAPWLDEALGLLRPKLDELELGVAASLSSSWDRDDFLRRLGMAMEEVIVADRIGVEIIVSRDNS